MFRPLCSGFIPRRNSYFDSSCAFCAWKLRDHPFLEATVWSPSGPFIEAGRSEVRIPNPDYDPQEAAA
jgi:hypothetical protein